MLDRVQVTEPRSKLESNDPVVLKQHVVELIPRRPGVGTSTVLDDDREVVLKNVVVEGVHEEIDVFRSSLLIVPRRLVGLEVNCRLI